MVGFHRFIALFLLSLLMLGSASAMNASVEDLTAEASSLIFLEDEFCGTTKPAILNCPKTLALECLCYLNQDSSRLSRSGDGPNLTERIGKLQKPELPVYLLPDFEVALAGPEWIPTPTSPPPRR